MPAHRSLFLVQEQSARFIYLKSALDMSLNSFPHSFRFSSKLNLFLDVLIQAVDLVSKVLGKLCPLCFQCWC